MNYIILLLFAIILYKTQLSPINIIIGLVIIMYMYHDNIELYENGFIDGELKNFVDSIEELTIYNETEMNNLKIYIDKFLKIYHYPHFTYCRYQSNQLKDIKNKILNIFHSFVHVIPTQTTQYQLFNVKLKELEDLLTQYYNKFDDACVKRSFYHANIDSKFDTTMHTAFIKTDSYNVF
jgi:hypothetical protein